MPMRMARIHSVSLGRESTTGPREVGQLVRGGAASEEQLPVHNHEDFQKQEEGEYRPSVLKRSPVQKTPTVSILHLGEKVAFGRGNERLEDGRREHRRPCEQIPRTRSANRPCPPESVPVNRPSWRASTERRPDRPTSATQTTRG